MALYPASIARCQHIKVNGTQCGSPSLRETTYCFFHIRYHWPAMEPLENQHDWHNGFPTLEDANSIQVTLAEVIQRMMNEEIDHKATALLLYAIDRRSTATSAPSADPLGA